MYNVIMNKIRNQLYDMRKEAGGLLSRHGIYESPLGSLGIWRYRVMIKAALFLQLSNGNEWSRK